MKKLNFTAKQKQELSKNKNIQKVSNCTVTFTEEFKLYAIKQHKLWRISELIFKEAGIPDWLNKKRYAKDCLKRWRKIFKRDGELGFKQENRGRPISRKTKPLSKMDKKELTTRIAYLEAENDFLKKLKALETV